MHAAIGVDLDNTLVSYDAVFHLAACEEGLIHPSLPGSKERVRDAIRLLPDGESRWTRLQAIVYGPRMAEAAAFDGIVAFFQHCAAAGTRVWIVSHKTPFASLDGGRVDIREAALRWMKTKGFFDPDGLALSPGDVFFESTRAEKIERIRALRCTHFIDDLAEVFAESAFPQETAKLLFSAHGAHSPASGVRAFKTWRELDQFFFG